LSRFDLESWLLRYFIVLYPMKWICFLKCKKHLTSNSSVVINHFRETLNFEVKVSVTSDSSVYDKNAPSATWLSSGRACISLTEVTSVRMMARTEGTSVRAMTFAEGISVRAMSMLPQIVGFVLVERACVKLGVFFEVIRKAERGASGKPSTWLPLGGHVQKDLLSSRVFKFKTSPVDQISPSVALEGMKLNIDLNCLILIFLIFQFVTPQIFKFLKL
jgi:hypothetical protein